MSKVDMTRYVECPVCHTYQITLNPCQKCLARRMSERGTLPPSGIVPLDPFKIYGQEQKALGNAPKKKREYSKESYEEMRKRMRKVAEKSNALRSTQTIIKKTPYLIDALRDGEPHYQADLQRIHAMPLGVTVTDWNVTRAMIQMGLIEWTKEGPFNNSPVKIWIPSLKMSEALEYAEMLRNGKNQRR